MSWFHRHRWTEATVKSHDRVFWYRQCRCGRIEVLLDGPLGCGEWRDAEKPWLLEYEREWFFSVLADSSHQARPVKRAKTP